MDFCRYVTWQILVFGFFCIFVQPVWRRWALSQPNLLLAMAFSTRQPPILQYPETSHAASVFAFAVPDGETGRERQELEKTQDADLHMPIQHAKVYTQKSHDSFCCVEFLKQFKANHRQSTLRIETLGVPAHYTKRIHQWAFCLENMLYKNVSTFTIPSYRPIPKRKPREPMMSSARRYDSVPIGTEKE